MINFQDSWLLPPLAQPLQTILTEMYGLAKGGLEQEREGEQQQVKGLKFISCKLIKLFQRNRKLKYSHISKVLIDNFSSQSNDSRNIKRRVYDAINVMVASGVFTKNGDMLEKQESIAFKGKVQEMKNELKNEQNESQLSINKKRMLASRLLKRKAKIGELILRNKEQSSRVKQTDIIPTPIFVGLKEGVKNVRIDSDSGQRLFELSMARASRGRVKGVSGTQIYADEEYLQYM